MRICKILKVLGIWDAACLNRFQFITECQEVTSSIKYINMNSAFDDYRAVAEN
jgi:hypothetical protein